MITLPAIGASGLGRRPAADSGRGADALLLDLLVSVRGAASRDDAGMRGRIVATAAALFAEQGYDATLMRDIAVPLGIKPASIYAHFAGGKSEVLGEALDDVLAAFHEFIVDGIRVDDPPVELLGHLLRRHVRYHVEHRSLAARWDLLYDIDRLAHALPEAVRQRLERRRARYRDLVCALVVATAPHLPHPRAMSEATLTLCDRASAWVHDGVGSTPEDASRLVWGFAQSLLAEQHRGLRTTGRCESPNCR